MTRAAFAAAILIAALPLPAAAQTPADAIEASAEAVQPPPAPPLNQGPMIVERLHSGFVFTPEVKATEFDERASGLIGGSAGWLSQETFFIGGGGYWMPDESNGRRLAYGGVVMQWFVVNGDRFGVSAKALLGGGEATLPETVTQVVGFPVGRDTDRLTPAQLRDLIQSHTVTTTLLSRQDFLAAEPELNARLSLAKHVRLTLGAGYRFAGNDWRHGLPLPDRGHRISGAVGSVGVQIGG